MKCPSCGYNSFDGLEHCKKCGADLEAARERFAPSGRVRTASGAKDCEKPPAQQGDPVPAFKPEELLSLDEPPAERKKQGELSGADDDESSQPSLFAAEIGEEFTAEPEMAPPAAVAGEKGPQPAEAAPAEDGRDDDAGRSADTGARRCLRPRLLAAAVDLLLLAVLVGLFVGCARLALAETSGPAFAPPLSAYLPLVAALGFSYFTLFHYLTGQSPGKMIFGLLVESREGGTLTFSQAFLRTFGTGLCLLSLGLGFAPLLWRADARGWNDRLAGSRVACVTRKTAD